MKYLLLVICLRPGAVIPRERMRIMLKKIRLPDVHQPPGDLHFHIPFSRDKRMLMVHDEKKDEAGKM